MNIFEKFCEDFTDKEAVEIIHNHLELESYARIGGCLLRTKAEEWNKIIDNSGSIVLVMNSIAMNCYKRFAMRYIEEIEK